MVAVAVLGEGGDGGGGARRGGVVVVGLKSVTVDTVETGGGETAGPCQERWSGGGVAQERDGGHRRNGRGGDGWPLPGEVEGRWWGSRA